MKIKKPPLKKEALSERPGSNWRHSAWKADALPTELLSHWYCSAKIACFSVIAREMSDYFIFFNDFL